MEKILPKKSNVKGIRLTDGSELIATIEEKSNGDYALTSALRVIIARDPQHGLVLDILPYSLITPRVIVVTSQAVAVKPFEIDADMEQSYFERVAAMSGIETASDISLLK